MLPLLPMRRDDLSLLYGTRPGEVHLGERVQCMKNDTYSEATLLEELSLKREEGVRVAILGVEEDLGPRANCGRPGSTGAWKAGISSFLNMQANCTLTGSEVVVVGLVDAHELQQEGRGEDVAKLRQLTACLDDKVFAVASTTFKAGLELVFIGGGHNNCLPLLAATSNTFRRPVLASNLDPHSDARSIAEGRHSGNGFSNALEKGYLSHYALMGYHKRYNSEATETLLRRYAADGKALCIAHEDWLDDQDHPFDMAQHKALKQVADFLDNEDKNAPRAIELDLDAIAFMPSSAWTPSGITLEFARAYVRRMARSKQVKYLDLAEGAPDLGGDIGVRHVGKAIAYLLADFIEVRKGVPLPDIPELAAATLP